MVISSPPNPTRPVWPLAVAAVVLSIFVRLLPYTVRLPNLAPIGALCLYSGARLPLWAAIGAPLIAMATSDFLLWKLFGDQPFSKFVYLAYAIAIVIGWRLRRTESPWRIAIGAVLASTLFFVITNSAAWYGMRGKEYEDSFNGWISGLIAGIPFHRGTFFGDALFVPLFFGAHALAVRLFPATQKAEV